MIVLITIIAALLRFYNLLWGDGLFFHPDERNMATAASQLCFQFPESILQPLSSIFQPRAPAPYPSGASGPGLSLEPAAAGSCSMNPHFFAYGAFPLYLAYLASQGWAFRGYSYQPLTPSFHDAVFWLRFWSALSSTLTIPLVFLIARKLLTFNFALLTATLVAFTPGLIQAAHFGTTESLLTFFFMLILYLSLKIMDLHSHIFNMRPSSQFVQVKQSPFKYYLIFLGISLGLSLATKLTAVYFLIPLLLVLLFKLKPQKIHDNLTNDRLSLKRVFLVLIVISSTFFLASPYNFLDFQAFLNTSLYETKVASGEIKTFYTRQFENTTPLLFQISKIFPYALGWPIFILGSLGFFLLIRQVSRREMPKVPHTSSTSNPFLRAPRQRNRRRAEWFLLLSFLAYFLPNAFLFAKWTRFMTPIFPFFAIFAAYLWYQVSGIRCQDRQCLHQKTALFREAAVSVGKGFYPLPSNTRIFLISQIKTFVKSLKNWRRAGDLSQHHLAAFGGLEVRDPELLSSATSAVHSPPRYIISILLILLSILPGLYFFQIYTKPDVRIQASAWIYQNTPDGSFILSETGSVVDIPLPNFKRPSPSGLKGWALKNHQTISFDFYHLDENPALLEELVNYLERADYILVPSRRIFANHLRLPEKYPITSNYYQALFDGRLGFELVQVQTYKGSEQPQDAEVPPKNRIENLPKLATQKVIRLVQIFTKRVGSFSKFSTETHERRFLRGYEAAAQAASGQLLADEAAEETWTVFDHPVVRIFKKITPHDKLYYQTLLKRQ